MKKMFSIFIILIIILALAVLLSGRLSKKTETNTTGEETGLETITEDDSLPTINEEFVETVDEDTYSEGELEDLEAELDENIEEL